VDRQTDRQTDVQSLNYLRTALDMVDIDHFLSSLDLDLDLEPDSSSVTWRSRERGWVSEADNEIAYSIHLH